MFRAANPNDNGSFNVFRMTDRDLSTAHYEYPHVNFVVQTPTLRGGFTETANSHVILTDFP